MDTDEPVRQVITSRGTNHRTGDLFMDAPIHESIDELTALAFDKHQWRLYVMALAGEGEFGTQPANTPEETKAAIDELQSTRSLLTLTEVAMVTAQEGSGEKQDLGRGSAKSSRTATSLRLQTCGALFQPTLTTHTTVTAR